jgi:hypothetical protein
MDRKHRLRKERPLCANSGRSRVIADIFGVQSLAIQATCRSTLNSGVRASACIRSHAEVDFVTCESEAIYSISDLILYIPDNLSFS